MIAELVFDGADVHIPSTWKLPRHDQMHGTPSEQLVEVAGRGCYDSMSTGRGSLEYHKHLVEVKHYSVHEHVHFTIETPLPGIMWVGIPDCTVIYKEDGMWRLTANIRHAIEWPSCATFEMLGNRDVTENARKLWQSTLIAMRHHLMPNVFPAEFGDLPKPPDFKICQPERDTEAFVSMFLEDSLVFSMEQNRHRGNISQRSGRFCDQTDRDISIHPYVREYLDECGYLALNPEDGEKLWKEPQEGMDQGDIQFRTSIGNITGSLIAQSRQVYLAWVNVLQPWLEKKGLSPLNSRKQARSAARYYLPSGLSTELLFTASIRHWRHIFNMRINPAADQAIHNLQIKAREVIQNSRFGHLL